MTRTGPAGQAASEGSALLGAPVRGPLPSTPPPPAAPRAPCISTSHEIDLVGAYRAWAAGARTFKARYRGKVLYERAVVALGEHLQAVPDTHALVRSWHDTDKRWATRALATANLRLASDQLAPCLAEAYQRRLQEIQRRMAGLP